MSDNSTKVNQITLHYGPIEVLNIWAHRPRRLKSLMENLGNLGFNVIAEPMLKRDYLIVKLSNIQIFSCRFSFLKFYSDNLDDFIIQRIIWAAIEARARFSVTNKP